MACESLRTSREMFSPWFVTLTTMPGMTAPEVSVTVPRIVPKVDWARAELARHNAIMATPKAKGLDFMDVSRSENRRPHDTVRYETGYIFAKRAKNIPGEKEQS